MHTYLFEMRGVYKWNIRNSGHVVGCVYARVSNNQKKKSTNSLRSEIELIQAIADGDKQALAELYNLYAEKIYNTALSYAKNIEDVEEITQDVFVKIYKGAALFEGKSSLNTWVYRIVVNTSLNHIKKKKPFCVF